VALVVAVLALAAASATANGPLTWSGAATDANWSDGTNWGGSPPSNPVGTLSFPSLASCTPPATCFTSNNNLPGLDVNALSFDILNSYGVITGDAITLGGGGLNGTTTGSGGQNVSFGFPITLSAPQTWTLSGAAAVTLEADVTGSSEALTLDTSGNATLGVSTDMEVGTANIDSGGSGGSGAVVYGSGSVLGVEGELNATDGNTVNVNDSELGTVSGGGASEVGPLAVTDGNVYIGDPGPGYTGILHVSGGATFDSSSFLGMYVGSAGTTAGTDYDQLSATGAVDLGGAQFALAGNAPGGACLTLNPGDVMTLITTTGALTGTFTGVPNGTTVSLGCDGGSGTPPTVTINYTAHTVTATVTGTGTTPTPTPTTTAGTRQSATQVNCYDTNPGAAGDYFQCTADVGDASTLSPAMVPGGSVQFVVNPGGGGGFQGSSTCDLAPSQTGAASAFCSVNYVPPAGGIAIGSQPPITATYSGSSVFASSSGQPQTLQAVQAGLCSAVYEPVCLGLVPLPADLADECVTLESGCTPGVQGDAAEGIDVTDDVDNLVVKTGNPTLTAEEWQAYLDGTGGPELTARVEYIKNANTYTNAVTLDRSKVLQSVQASLATGETAGGYAATTYSATSVLYTDSINKLYDLLGTIGTSTTSDNTSLTLSDAWCSGTQNPAGCKENVAAIQTALNGAIANLSAQKAMLGVNAPYVPPPPAKSTKGQLVPALAKAARRNPTVLSTVVLAAIQKVSLAPGQTRTIHMPVPAFVRAAFKHDLGEGIRTLHARLVVEISDSNGDFTTRAIPVTIHLAKPKKKHH
jgi:hypothetical protein